MLSVRRWWVPLMTAAVITAVMPATSAMAGGGTNCDEAGCDVTATSPPRKGKGGGGGSGGKPVCTYRDATPKPGATSALGGKPREGGKWYWKNCTTDGDDVGELVWLPDPVAQPSPEELGAEARGRLNPPAPVLRVSPAESSLVNVPVWLSLGDSWRPVTASAAVPGVTVTATATPKAAVWSMGDGSTVRCTSRGSAFRPGVDSPQAASPDCGHTYRRSSARASGGAYAVSVTVTWAVSWSGGGGGGALGDLTTTAGTTLRVAESQTVITG